MFYEAVGGDVKMADGHSLEFPVEGSSLDWSTLVIVYLTTRLGYAYFAASGPAHVHIKILVSLLRMRIARDSYALFLQPCFRYFLPLLQPARD